MSQVSQPQCSKFFEKNGPLPPVHDSLTPVRNRLACLKWPKMHWQTVSIVGYLLVSAVMLNTNKLALQTFEAPYLLTLVQTVFTVLVLSSAACLGGNFTLSIKNASRFFLPGIVWSLPLAFNMQALKYLNPEAIVVFRVATVFGVALGDLVYFAKVFRGHELLSLFCITYGAAIYVSGDVNCSFTGYLWGTAYWASMIVSVLLLKAVFNVNKNVGNAEKTLYLNLNGIPVFALLFWLAERHKFGHVVNSLTNAGAFVILFSCILAVLIGFLANITRDALSPTAFDVLSNTAKLLTVAISYSLFKTRYTPFSTLGLLMALLGGSLYSPEIFGKIQQVTSLELELLNDKCKHPTRAMIFIILVPVILGISMSQGTISAYNIWSIEERGTPRTRPAYQMAQSNPHSVRSIEKAFTTQLALVKVAEVDINETEPFFLSIMTHGDSLMGSYRTSWAHTSRVGYLNDDFQLNVAYEVPGVEDARTVVFDGTSWLVDNHPDFPRVMVSHDGTRRLTLNESELGVDFQRGKNWSPFVYRGELYFVYSLEPVKILKCEWPEGKLKWVFFDGHIQDATRSGYEYLRGGTNSLVFGEHLYGVARYSYHVKKKFCKGNEVNSWKEHFPVLWSLPLEGIFSSEDSLRTDKVRKLKIREIKHPFTEGVNDPASLFVWKEEVYVSITSCSCDCFPGATELNDYVRNSIYKITADL